MHDSDRRAFLKKIAATTAYAAPVVRTLAAPDPAAGQVLSKKGGDMGMGKGKGMNMGKGFMKGWDMFPSKSLFHDAPWEIGD